MSEAANVLGALDANHTGFVFVKTVIGSRPSAKYGLSDKLITVMADCTVIDTDSVIYIGDQKLVDMVYSATKLGLAYNVWKKERPQWLAMADVCDARICRVIKSFDVTWQNVAQLFYDSPKRVARPVCTPKVSTLPGFGTAMQSMLEDGVRTVSHRRPCLSSATALTKADSTSLVAAHSACAQMVGGQQKKLYKTLAEKDMAHFETFFNKYRLTSFCFPNIKHADGVIEILSGSELFEEYEELIGKMKLCPLTEFQIEKSIHYVLMSDNKIVSGMSVIFAVVKNMPTMVCASVEVVVSKTKGNGTILVDMLTSSLLKRKSHCFMVSQAARTFTAKKFWSKNAITRKEANYLTFMLYSLDNRYHICCDTTPMCLLF